MRNEQEIDPKKRFTDRVENYVRYRPGYPQEMIEFLHDVIGLKSDWTIADVGSGTGISSKLFLENGNRVYGIEPNEAMRNAAIRSLDGYPGFTSLDGTADATGLRDESIELVFSAQSFHWFCNANTVAEFRRILRPRGIAVLVWNERETKIDDFHIGYEDLLLRFGTDYEQIRHDKITITELETVFGTKFRQKTFNYKQLLDLQGVKGRILSCSYVPTEGAANFDKMMNELEALFAVYAEMGKITVLYKTKFFYCSI